MPTLKEYNIKLVRLRSTHKMTKTMKMVAANKLRKAQEAHRKAQDFVHSLNAVVSRVAFDRDMQSSPFLLARPVSRILVLVVTADRGLCGGFNNNLNKKVVTWIASKDGEKAGIEASFCGRKGFTFFKNRARVRQNYEGVAVKPTVANAAKVGADLRKAFLDGEADEVYLAYNMAGSAMSHTPTIERILPVARTETALDRSGLEAWIVEPAGEGFMDALIPRYVNMKVFFALLCNSMGEHGARMAAMDNATRNAENLISVNTLLRNRARQSKITTELIEIVAGAETLR